jgi:predicted ABC-type transport system involved in lysophospholipase L1 biosynthesis ATPase subunit
MNESNSSPTLLEARAVRKIFPRGDGDLLVLDGCDFTLEEGQAVAVVGESGSGKSTFLNILGALDHCTSGEILYQGKRLDFENREVVDHWRSQQIGFVFQSHMLLPDFTALENLLMPARRLGPLKAEARQRAQGFLEDMGLSDRANHLPGELSGGEQQRIAVARAFMNKPSIVLADEPFGNLDQKIGSHLGDMLFGLRDREGTSLVIVTHDLNLARQADLILKLQNGKLVPSENPSSP